jgi:N-carbamoyl-L-amino-acid hydrolase
VVRDDMGVMYARRPGQRPDVPPIAIGSHLDTQPTGGKFDGTLGVLAALEVLRTLHEAGYATFAPIELINWTNEEGARFPRRCWPRGCSPACSRASGPRPAPTRKA